MSIAKKYRKSEKGISNMYDLNTIKRLTNDYGSPLYVFRVDDFIENYRIFEESFKSRYPKYKIAYSYKTNYTPEICSIREGRGLSIL